jgi:hypothetical protein
MVVRRGRFLCGAVTYGDFHPQFHVHYAERVPWIELADGLPRFDHHGSGDV